MTIHYKAGTVAMVTAINRNEPYRAAYDGRTWRELDHGAAFCVDNPTSIHPLAVLDLPDGAKAGWDVLIGALEDARVKTGYLMVFDGLIEQIKAEVFPPAPWREWDGAMAPWPVVSECLSVHAGHECPQCSWEHDHDWVAWVGRQEFRAAAGCPGSGVPVRCSKCGARKCDQPDCARRRHTHTHAGEAVPA